MFKKKKDKAVEETTAVEFAAPPETEINSPETAFTASEAVASLIAENEPVPTVTAELDAPAISAVPSIPAPQVVIPPIEPPKPVEPPVPEEPPKPVFIVPEDATQAVKDIVDGKLDMLLLDYTSDKVKEIVLQCLKEKPSLAQGLDVNDENQREILKRWVDCNYSNLLLLDKNQRHTELVNIYLEHIFKAQLQLWHDENNAWFKDISIEHSFTGQQVIHYSYITKEGELVSYFDNYLGMPVKLKTQAALKIKITNALSLVKGLDIELEKVDLGTLAKFINIRINNCLRDTILGTIEAKKISYYDLPRFFSFIKDKLTSGLQSQFTKCGLAVTDADIKDISITNDAIEKFENQYFTFAQLARKKEFENKLEAASLKLYEQKAAIHDKYPNFATGLTEEEKDRALERYLKRIGKDIKPEVEEIKREVIEKVADPGKLPPKKPEDEQPIPPKALAKNDTFRVLYGIFGGLWLAAGVVLTVMLFSQIIIGACVLGSGVVAMIVAGICGGHLLRYGYTKSAKKKYDAEMEVYQTKLADYNAKMDKYNKELAEYNNELMLKK